jgi:hypothetical protein
VFACDQVNAQGWMRAITRGVVFAVNAKEWVTHKLSLNVVRVKCTTGETGND